MIVHLSFQFKPEAEAIALAGIWPDSDLTDMRFRLVQLCNYYVKQSNSGIVSYVKGE